MDSNHPITPILGEHQREPESEPRSPPASSSSSHLYAEKPEEFDHITLDNFDHASADATVLDDLENIYGLTYNDDPSLFQLAAVLVEALIPKICPLGPIDPKYLQRSETRQFLASTEALQRKIKECWKKRKFEEIRTLASFYPPQARPPPRRRAASSLRVRCKLPSEDEVIGS